MVVVRTGAAVAGRARVLGTLANYDSNSLGTVETRELIETQLNGVLLQHSLIQYVGYRPS